jgi:hypothetical protein
MGHSFATGGDKLEEEHAMDIVLAIGFGGLVYCALASAVWAAPKR